MFIYSFILFIYLLAIQHVLMQNYNFIAFIADSYMNVTGMLASCASTQSES